MDSIRALFAGIKETILIENIDNGVIFMNDSFKFKINLDNKKEINRGIISELILKLKQYDSHILEILKLNLEKKNVETELHTNRVASYCIEMGRAMQLDEDMIKKAGWVGHLHDIGKIGISDKILLKPSKLTSEEYEIMKTHSKIGYKLACLFPEVRCVSKEILTHHEKWDGTGYPLGLKGEAIPILSRIVAIADSFDAMIEDRCYSRGRSIDDAIIELQRCAGTQFDPELVEVFIGIIDKIKEVMTA